MIPFIYMLQYRSIAPYVRFAHHCSDPLVVQDKSLFDHELVLILEGTGSIGVESQTLAFRNGSLLLIPPGIKHSFKDGEGVTFSHIAIHFDWEPMEKESLWLQKITHIADVPSAISNIMGKIADDFQSKREYRLMTLQVGLQQLLLQLAELLHREELFYDELDDNGFPQASGHKGRSEIITVVTQLQQLADQSPLTKAAFDQILVHTHYSKAHVRRIFKQHTGFTPHHYFTLLRLRKAVRLLFESNSTIKDIAYQCGFDDEKYFSKLFRQKECMSPQEYRSSVLNRKE